MHQFSDFRALLPQLRVDTIFDVGANVGQSARAFRRELPNARIYCFEPAARTYAALVQSVSNDSNITTHQIALSDHIGEAMMATAKKSVGSYISHQGDEAVALMTGDSFCEEKGIASINFLKIDTEGHDLSVCNGFSRMLREARVDVLQVEAGLSYQNKTHVPLQEFAILLRQFDYDLFRIYDQAGIPLARRCNAVFISARTALANQNPKRKKSQGSWL